MFFNAELIDFGYKVPQRGIIYKALKPVSQ